MGINNSLDPAERKKRTRQAGFQKMDPFVVNVKRDPEAILVLPFVTCDMHSKGLR